MRHEVFSLSPFSWNVLPEISVELPSLHSECKCHLLGEPLLTPQATRSLQDPPFCLLYGVPWFLTLPHVCVSLHVSYVSSWRAGSLQCAHRSGPSVQAVPPTVGAQEVSLT